MHTVTQFLTVLAIGLVVSTAHGQVGEEWASPEGSADRGARGPDGGLVEAVGGTGGDVFYDVVKTSDGGVVAVGYTSSFGAGGKDVLLVKFTTDGCGDILWRKTLGGSDDEEGRSIIEVVPGGDLVVTGITSSVGGAGEHLLISRFDSLGEEVWTTILYDTSLLVDYESRGYDVIMDESERLVVTGTVFSSDLGQYSLLLARFNANDGTLLDKAGFRILGLPFWDHWGESLIESCTNNYLVVGGSLKPTSGDQAVFFLRVGANLGLGWARWLREGTDNAVGHCITLSHNNEPLITGRTGDDLFVSKWDCDGTPVAGLQKKLTPGSTEGHSIIEESFDPFILVVTGQYGSPGQVLVSRWTDTLDLVGGRFWTWGGTEAETGYSVAEDINQRLWIAGETSSWGAGGQDGLLAKLDADGHVCVQETGFLTTPATWSPTESVLTLTALPLIPLEDQAWAVDSADALQLQQHFECDDECEEECCLDDGTCAFLTPIDCEAANGTPQGAGTTCSPTGACCLPDDSCVETTETCCTNAGGVYQGAGTHCTAVEACCFSDGSCETLDPLCCVEAGGVAQGGGTFCTALEACCMPDDTCEMYDPECCDDMGGVAQGFGTSCTTLETCCLPDGTCTLLDPLCCVAAGGTSHPGEPCTGPLTCCLPDGSCVLMDPLCCADLGGITHGKECLGDSNANGIDDLCDNRAVPALSPWGLGVLVLVLVAAGVTVLRRRRPATA